MTALRDWRPPHPPRPSLQVVRVEVLHHVRLAAHRRFVAEREAAGKPPKHHNTPHDVPVITGQETDLTLYEAVAARLVEGGVEVDHARV